MTLKNDKVPIAGTSVISGNIPRTVTGWWRSTQSKVYNIYECGRYRSGQTFSLRRRFGTQEDLHCHTGGGCFDSSVGKTGKILGPSDNTWHHFAHVWDGSSHFIYYDGELYSKGTDRKNRTLSTYENGCVFGSKDDRFSFKGDIKGLRIYSTALTLEDIVKIKGKFLYLINSR